MPVCLSDCTVCARKVDAYAIRTLTSRAEASAQIPFVFIKYFVMPSALVEKSSALSIKIFVYNFIASMTTQMQQMFQFISWCPSYAISRCKPYWNLTKFFTLYLAGPSQSLAPVLRHLIELILWLPIDKK